MFFLNVTSALQHPYYIVQFSLFMHPDQAQNTSSGIQGQEATAVAVIYVTAPLITLMMLALVSKIIHYEIYHDCCGYCSILGFCEQQVSFNVKLLLSQMVKCHGSLHSSKNTPWTMV